MNNTELIARLRKLSAENKSPRDCIDEAADALEAAQPKDPCGTCGKQVNYYRSGCPGCGAPVCCEACCRANQKSDTLRGEIAYQLTKQLVIDMPTARAAVDSAFNASDGAAQPVVSLQAAHDSVTIDSLNDRVMHLLREKAKLIETVDELRDELQEARETLKPPLKVHRSAGDYLRHKAATAAQPAGEPVAWVVAIAGRPISMTVPVSKIDVLSKMHNAPLFTHPAPQVPMTQPVKQAPPKGWMPDALRRAGFSEDEIKGVKP